MKIYGYGFTITVVVLYRLVLLSSVILFYHTVQSPYLSCVNGYLTLEGTRNIKYVIDTYSGKAGSPSARDVGSL